MMNILYNFAPGDNIFAVDVEKWSVRPGQVQQVEIDVFQNGYNIIYWSTLNNSQGSWAVDERNAFLNIQDAFAYLSQYFNPVSATPTSSASMQSSPTITPTLTVTSSSTPTNTPTPTPTITFTTSVTPSYTPTNTPTITPTPSAS